MARAPNLAEDLLNGRALHEHWPKVNAPPGLASRRRAAALSGALALLAALAVGCTAPKRQSMRMLSGGSSRGSRAFAAHAAAERAGGPRARIPRILPP
jgi:hypothetical protein